MITLNISLLDKLMLLFDKSFDCENKLEKNVVTENVPNNILFV